MREIVAKWCRNMMRKSCTQPGMEENKRVTIEGGWEAEGGALEGDCSRLWCVCGWEWQEAALRPEKTPSQTAQRVEASPRQDCSRVCESRDGRSHGEDTQGCDNKMADRANLSSTPSRSEQAARAAAACVLQQVVSELVLLSLPPAAAETLVSVQPSLQISIQRCS